MQGEAVHGGYTVLGGGCCLKKYNSICVVCIHFVSS